MHVQPSITCDSARMTDCGGCSCMHILADVNVVVHVEGSVIRITTENNRL